jgi:CheY-like chemotaxis protein
LVHAAAGKTAGSAAQQTGPLADLVGTRLARARALIVDDNAANREILLARLESWGLRATAVADGPAALTALHQAQTADDPFQLALIDMQMPGMDGESLGRVIKADERLADDGRRPPHLV